MKRKRTILDIEHDIAQLRAHGDDGVCCCGDSMDNHGDPFYAGHMPVNAYAHYMSQLLEERAQAMGGAPVTLAVDYGSDDLIAALKYAFTVSGDWVLEKDEDGFEVRP